MKTSTLGSSLAGETEGGRGGFVGIDATIGITVEFGGFVAPPTGPRGLVGPPGGLVTEGVPDSTEEAGGSGLDGGAATWGSGLGEGTCFSAALGTGGSGLGGGPCLAMAAVVGGSGLEGGPCLAMAAVVGGSGFAAGTEAVVPGSGFVEATAVVSGLLPCVKGPSIFAAGPLVTVAATTGFLSVAVGKPWPITLVWLSDLVGTADCSSVFVFFAAGASAAPPFSFSPPSGVLSLK